MVVLDRRCALKLKILLCRHHSRKTEIQKNEEKKQSEKGSVFTSRSQKRQGVKKAHASKKKWELLMAYRSDTRHGPKP